MEPLIYSQVPLPLGTRMHKNCASSFELCALKYQS
jgi:hypothetical protein